jgi:adenine phosphoribosyltransferase
MSDLKALCRSIPDFPKEGILFYDITPMLREGDSFRQVIDGIGERYQDKQIDVVVSIEARGFIIGPAVAYKLGAGVVPVRKKGKLPWQCYQATYELEYGTDVLEIHRDAIKPGERVLIFDDLLATGGTARAVTDLVRKMGGEIVEVAFMIELLELGGRERLPDYPVFSLIQY